MISVEELSRQVADLCPEDHLKSFLRRDCRPDGRSLGQPRPVVVAEGVIKTCDSSSLVRLGKTKCLAGVRAQLTEPGADEPECGTISLNLEFSSLSSSNAKSGPPDEKSQSLAVYIDDILNNIVDRKQLGIEADKLAWAVFIDVYCLEDDGNVTDAALMAVVKSLKELKLPVAKVETDETTGRTKWHVDKNERVVGLTLKEIPISTTFGEFSGILLIDPTLSETKLGSSPITVVCGASTGTVMAVTRAGGAALSQEATSAAIETAQQRTREIYQQFFV